MIRNAKIGSKKHSIQVRFFSYILTITERTDTSKGSKYSASFPIFGFVYFACQVYWIFLKCSPKNIFRIGKEMNMFTNFDENRLLHQFYWDLSDFLA